MKKFWLLALTLLALASPANAVDLATAFGVAGAPLSNLTTPGHACFFQATHGSSIAIGEVTITANGSDSAVVTLLCNGVSITATLPSIDVNGHQVSSVAFPQTVTSSAPGSWTVTVAGKIQFTVVAQ